MESLHHLPPVRDVFASPGDTLPRVRQQQHGSQFHADQIRSEERCSHLLGRSLPPPVLAPGPAVSR